MRTVIALAACPRPLLLAYPKEGLCFLKGGYLGRLAWLGLSSMPMEVALVFAAYL